MESDYHFSFHPHCNDTADVRFFYSTYSSFCNCTCLWSMKRSCSTILWEFFNDFWLLRRFLLYAFVNSSPSPVKFWFDTDSTEWRELVPRQRIGDCSEIHALCSAVIKSPYFSCSQNGSLSVFEEVSMDTVLPFLCLHFWSITFRIWVLSYRGMCEHMRLQVLQIDCEGL